MVLLLLKQFFKNYINLLDLCIPVFTLSEDRYLKETEVEIFLTLVSEGKIFPG